MILDRRATPGCNIGPDEIARRRRSAVFGTIIAVVIAGVLVAVATPAWVRFLFWPVATGVAITWLQVVHRFCVAFGALGIENFGRLGEQIHVDPAIRAADRRRALQVILEGAAIGLPVALALAVLPLR